jgi:hypothetical protein
MHLGSPTMSTRTGGAAATARKALLLSSFTLLVLALAHLLYEYFRLGGAYTRLLTPWVS